MRSDRLSCLLLWMGCVAGTTVAQVAPADIEPADLLEGLDVPALQAAVAALVAQPQSGTDGAGGEDEALNGALLPEAQGDPSGSGEGVETPVDTAAPGPFRGSVAVSAYDLVDLHVQAEDLGAVLQLLSLQAERNIVVSRNVNATVTADLYGVSFYDALDALLHVNGFGYVQRGEFVYVYTQEELAQIQSATRQRVARVIELNFLNAVDAARFVAPLLSVAADGDTGGTITTPNESAEFVIPDATPTGKDDYANEAMLVVYDYPENIEAIEAVIEQIDTRPTQVLIEATILQAQITEENAFGIDFSIIADLDFVDFANPLEAANRLISATPAAAAAGAGGAVAGGTGVTGAAGANGVNQGIVPADGQGRAISSTVGNTGGAGGLKVGIIDEDVAVFLRVLDEVTDVTVISNPKVLTLNRQPARVLVGTRVGYLSTTTTQTATTESVQFLDTGTQLHVRPFVTNDGLIRLELKPQVSAASLRAAVSSTGRTLTVPDEDTTELVTNLFVRDGQTVVLGGLFTESTTSTRRQVPFFGDLPIIGTPFRGQDDSVRRSEIIFLIKPSVVNDDVLTLEGRTATRYAELASVGARQGLLPWSRERQVGQLLIDAERLAREGEDGRALLKVQRALTLQPSSPDAHAVRDRLAGTRTPAVSRSLLHHILDHSAPAGATPPGSPSVP